MDLFVLKSMLVLLSLVIQVQRVQRLDLEHILVLAFKATKGMEKLAYPSIYVKLPIHVMQMRHALQLDLEQHLVFVTQVTAEMETIAHPSTYV
jgi:hypothetical protein